MDLKENESLRFSGLNPVDDLLYRGVWIQCGAHPEHFDLDPWEVLPVESLK